MKEIENDPVLDEIEVFCKSCGISVSTFGELAMNDRGLVRSLRLGRDCRRKTGNKIREYMTQNPPKPTNQNEAA